MLDCTLKEFERELDFDGIRVLSWENDAHSLSAGLFFGLGKHTNQDSEEYGTTPGAYLYFRPKHPTGEYGPAQIDIPLSHVLLVIDQLLELAALAPAHCFPPSPEIN